MLQVESAVACDDPRGEYWVWAHYLTRRHTAELVKMVLPGTELDITNALGPLDNADPQRIVDLAATVPNQHEHL